MPLCQAPVVLGTVFEPADPTSIFCDRVVVAILICSSHLIMAAPKIVATDLSLRYNLRVAGYSTTKKLKITMH